MPNPENLKPITNSKEAKEKGRRGGKASGEARRKKKLMREAFDELLAKEYTDPNGQKLDGTTILAMKVFKKAMDGDMRAFELIRDTAGQKPVERVESVEISPETYDKVKKALE